MQGEAALEGHDGGFSRVFFFARRSDSARRRERRTNFFQEFSGAWGKSVEPDEIKLCGPSDGKSGETNHGCVQNFFQKSIDPICSPTIVSIPLTERPSRIDLKRTGKWPKFRDEKFAVAPGSN